jgi:hypothetical protein
MANMAGMLSGMAAVRKQKSGTEPAAEIHVAWVSRSFHRFRVVALLQAGG